MRDWVPVPRHQGIFSYETKRGTRFGVRRGFKNALGRRDEFHPSGFRTWRDADHALKDFEATLVNGNLGPLTNRSVTLGDYFDQYAKRKLANGKWREVTFKQFTLVFDTHIRPAFGYTPISQIRRLDYTAFLDSLADDVHLSKAYIETIDKIMLAVINDAVRNDVIYKNQLGGIEKHGASARSVTVTPEEFERWQTAALTKLNRYQLAVVFVDALGLRIGECLGLRTNSIDFKQGPDGQEVASIKIDMQRGPNYPTGGPLKNDASYRTIWVQNNIVDLLHFAVLTSNNLRAKNHVPGTELDWLWLLDDGRPMSSYYLRKYIKAANTAAGTEIRPHMLRHYFASQAVGNGSQIDAMKYLGHKNLQMTADYVRPTEESSLKVFTAANLARKLPDKK